MKIITRRQLLDIQGTVIYAEYNSYFEPDSVYIKYGNIGDNDWCEEEFPIKTPEWDRGSFLDVVDRFNVQRESKVGTADT